MDGDYAHRQPVSIFWKYSQSNEQAPRYAGLGVGFLSFAIEQAINLQDNNLIAAPIEEEWAKRRILLCVRKEQSSNPILQKFLEAFIKK